jgi:hypothetical protein
MRTSTTLSRAKMAPPRSKEEWVRCVSRRADQFQPDPASRRENDQRGCGRGQTRPSRPHGRHAQDSSPHEPPARASRITDPAPVASSKNLRRHRGVWCIRWSAIKVSISPVSPAGSHTNRQRRPAWSLLCKLRTADCSDCTDKNSPGIIRGIRRIRGQKKLSFISRLHATNVPALPQN